MKQQLEKRVALAIKQIMLAMNQNIEDTGEILAEFDTYHSDAECEQSKQYKALVTCHFALKEALERINNQLNKK